MNGIIVEIQRNKGRLMMLASSIFVCIGQLCWKLGTKQIPLVLTMLGFGLYAMGALIMLYAYRFGKMSALQPMLSMNYVFSTLLGVIVLGEVIQIQMLLGIVVIISGVVLLGGEDAQ